MLSRNIGACFSSTSGNAGSFASGCACLRQPLPLKRNGDAINVLRIFALVLWILAAGQASAATIGIAGPLSGPLAAIGTQIRAGAEMAADGKAETVFADELCTEDGGKAAAETFIAAKASVVTGFACTESLLAALPLLKAAQIPVISPVIRTNSLTDQKAKTGFLFYRLAPRGDAEAKATVRILSEKWRTALFAIADDGTVHARDLAETFRLGMEEAGLKPVFTDTFRPLLGNQIGMAGRMRKSGATHLFMAGDAGDVAIFARDAAGLGYKPVIAGGEALRAAPGEVELAKGILTVAPLEWAGLADADILASLAAKSIAPDGYVLAAHAAMQVAIAAAGSPEGPLAALATTAFATSVGEVSFDEKGELGRELYRLFEWQNQGFAEIP